MNLKSRHVFVLVMLVLLYIAGGIMQSLLTVVMLGFIFTIGLLADIRDELVKQREKDE